MFRKLLSVVAAMALPSLLAAQTPAPIPASARMAPAHPVATQVQGEVVMAAELDGMNNQDGVDEADGQNNDGEFENGEFNQEGVNEPDGLNNDVDVSDQVDQVGEDQDGDDPPPPPPGTGQLGRIGRHRP
jgi:hypothetical protein